MARKRNVADESASESESAEAAVLVDFHHDGKRVPAGSVFAGSSEDVKRYAKDGLVDPHVDAVAYAKSLKA